MPWGELVGAINQQNESWVSGVRRLSPNVVTELLAWSGAQVADYFGGLDLMAQGSAVSWAGPDRAPKWLDVAREYTERWMHQEQIREAVGAPGLREPRLFGPVLSTFVHALPHTYRDVAAEDGTAVRVVITGEAGGAWWLVRQGGEWRLFEDVSGSAQTVVTLSEDTAWRLFTKGLELASVEALVHREGVEELGRPFLSTVGIIA